MLVTELDTTDDEASPSLTASGRVIVSTSRRAGSLALDIWYATRMSATAPFETPQRVPTVNSPAGDYTPFVRQDGCELLFASDRGGALEDLYRSTIVP